MPDAQGRLSAAEITKPDGYLEFDAGTVNTLPRPVRECLRFYTTRQSYGQRTDEATQATVVTIRYHMAGYRVREVEQMLTAPSSPAA